ncbi:hypothetical protein D6779_00155 [Candidatus Parcubacteria bacterium]|nr:MAG: hypothetical protein D6779_00155 [Candidatus Parcubacteria bacterium]
MQRHANRLLAEDFIHFFSEEPRGPTITIKRMSPEEPRYIRELLKIVKNPTLSRAQKVKNLAALFEWEPEIAEWLKKNLYGHPKLREALDVNLLIVQHEDD